MNTYAVILGDVRSLLNTGSVELLDPTKWTQRDSDIIVHAIQVYTQISKSRWNASEITFTTRGDHRNEQFLDSSFPNFDDFIFAAVYFRQLIGDSDKLLKDAVDRYKAHVACRIRQDWVQYELDCFDGVLKSEPFPLKISGFTSRELFDAFMYGASLMHKVCGRRSKAHRDFLQIYDNYPREKVLFALNSTLKELLRHTCNIVVPMHKDLSEWQSKYSLPLPDIRWHHNLFATQERTSHEPARAQNAPPVVTHRFS